MLSTHHCPNERTIFHPVILALVAAGLFSVACDGGPIAPVPILRGIVTNSTTGYPVSGVEVRIGGAIDTTSGDGRFGFINLPAGEAVLRCTASGFKDFETVITVTDGTTIRDVGLTRLEVFEFDKFSLYVPASVPLVRGVIVALGGPDTRGFATGKRFGAPIAEVEASLQVLGEAFRALASTHGLAIVGTSRAAMPNGPASDTLLFRTIEQFAVQSGRSEIAYAHFLLYGMSGGGPQASGFAARNPDSVVGLFLKVPSGVSSVIKRALGVPTYIVLAELDAFVNNVALTAAFESNLGAGALWAMAMERGVPHNSLSVLQRQATINWINAILERRLPSEPGWDPLYAIVRTSGWLGNGATGEAAPWATYEGDRALASWLPSATTASDWETLVAPAAITLRQKSPIR